MIFFAEDFLWNGIREFIAHYHGGEIIKAWIIGLSLQSNGSPQKQELSDDDNGSAECSIITIEMRREGTEIPNPILGYYGVCDFTPACSKPHFARTRVEALTPVFLVRPVSTRSSSPINSAMDLA